MTGTFLQASTATSDPYFSHFDPRTEHQSYKDAQQRLEETHREKVYHKIELYEILVGVYLFALLIIYNNYIFRLPK